MVSLKKMEQTLKHGRAILESHQPLQETRRNVSPEGKLKADRIGTEANPHLLSIAGYTVRYL